ncbi:MULTISPECIES: hypothetical protein [unclassified Clostridioides]|uniref:hypothetical protein n=1 Tax=unclassified Clostridioides TaxID=2635829 RepID=UPI001D12F7EF|nr:hypothetical protein [Clostridioides sp. ZZV14-6048]MCC0739986.1 hypothetical protein [Clostridioides sp. ZZV14-5902]
MKRKILIIFLCTLLLSSVVSFGDGGGNVDGGGGSTGGGGDKKNYWTAGDEGVRITIIDDKTQTPVTKSIDLTNRNMNNIQGHFGKVSKIDYRNGKKLNIDSGKYTYINPKEKLPVIISSKTYGKADIDKIKKYFCNTWTQQLIANKTGFDYEQMKNGEYKILLEPVAYFTFQGVKMGMTATEAALYNKKLGGNKFRNKFASISHKNLPLSMFLENNDLGFKAWKGISDTDKAKAKDDDTIIKMLGLGIVYFKNEPPIDDEVIIPPVNPPKPDEPDDGNKKEYEYRTDTDVISSIKVSGKNRTPDNPVNINFEIKGKTYVMKNIYLPKEGGEQYAWVKWRTPKNPEKITIKVTSNATTDKATIIANIVDLKEKTPPDPIAKDKKPNNYKIPSTISNQSASTEYGEWDCYWVSHWVYYSDGESGGEWVDEGWWEWKWIPYTVTLSSSMNLKADSIIQTSKKEGKEIKSGYGVNTIVNSKVGYNAPQDSVTGGQNVIVTFPEFNYEKYNRILQSTKLGYESSFVFKNNKYSTYNSKVHFTPLWFPDGEYTTNANVIDVWTPTGMLSVNINNYVDIKGNLYDDWHIGPAKQVS